MENYVYADIMGKEKVKVSKDRTLLNMAEEYADLLPNHILLAKVNNQITELTRTLTEDSKVEFLDVTHTNGYRAYQRSVVMLMLCSAKQILGRKAKIVVEHSINSNYYCEIPEEHIEITDNLLLEIENGMHELCKRELPIERLSISVDEGMALAREFGLEDKELLMKYRKTTNVNFYKVDWFLNYFYGPMVSNTKCLKSFKLEKKNEGFLIVFPDQKEPSKLNEVKSFEKLSKIHHESSQWGKILKVDTVGALNDIITNDGFGDIIKINEALHEKKLAWLADQICDNEKRIVLVSGPSSSGKTTFANRLCIQLRVNGINPYVISLDNYYLDREFAPLDEFGQPDFETIDAIDVEGVNRDLEKLVRGETVDIPTFNFRTGKQEHKGNFLKLGENDVLVVEGIHGLNDRISQSVADKDKYKIYISALTQLNIDSHNRIPTTDTRLIRRLVRDHQFRGFDPITTISIWPSVVRGENKYIFPNQERADAMFNSSLVYEMCILKQYAEPLLFKIDRSMPEYPEAKRLLKFLDLFIGVSSERVPNNSILREFIGGSSFKV